MGKPGDGARLTVKSGDEPGVVGEVRVQQLEGDVTIKGRIDPFPYLGHSPPGDGPS